MSYVINNSRGNLIAVVADGTINQSATSLALVGRSVTNYGGYENENYVYLLENFANNTEPSNSILGQLWYNSDTDVLSVYDSANVWTALASQDYVDAQKISPVFTGVPRAPTALPGTANTQIATTAFVTNSPEFAGIPTAPTAAAGTNTDQIATTAFVTNSPEFAGIPIAPTAAPGTNTGQIATTAFVQGEKTSPTFLGTPTAPTAAAGTNTDQIATTAFVQGEKTSPVFLGTPTAPTAAAGTNTGQVATTAFVQGEKTSPVFLGTPTAPTAAPGTANTQIATTAFVIDSIIGPNRVLGSISAQNANAVSISGGSITGITDLAVADGGTGSSTAPGARINLGLGTLSTQDASSVTITGGSVTGIADLAVADGGTGASTAPNARTNLGLGTLSTQDASSVSISGGSITGASVSTNNISVTGGSITGITPLAVADGGTGASTALQARINLGIEAAISGLGTMSTQNANSVSITGGNISGISPLLVSDGGTGASTAAGAITNLGAVPISRTISTGNGLSGGGSLSSNLTLSILANSNGYGNRTISTAFPSGGSSGDIWYRVVS